MNKYTYFFLVLCITCFFCPFGYAATHGHDGIEQTGAVPIGQDITTQGNMTESFIAGSMVGTLLGYPYEAVGVADIVVAAICIYLMFKTILHFGLPSSSSIQKQFSAENEESVEDTQEILRKRAEKAWTALRTKSAEELLVPQTNLFSNAPKDFDSVDFLDGAKLFFSFLQKAWAERKVDSITGFVTPEMLEDMQDLIAEDPTPSSLQVKLISAEIEKVERTGTTENASVFFEFLVQKKSGENPFEAQEIWHFTHNFVEPTSWQLNEIEEVIKKTELHL